QLKAEKHLRLSGLLLYVDCTQDELFNILKNIKIDKETIKKIVQLLTLIKKPIRNKIDLKWRLNAAGEKLVRDLLHLKEIKRKVESSKWQMEERGDPCAVLSITNIGADFHDH